jgi:hypothetical protein
MPRIRTYIATALLAAPLMTAPVLGQEASGTITGTKELEDAIWYVTAEEGETLSRWHWDGNEAVVTLVGHVLRDTTTLGPGDLTIRFRTEGNPAELEVGEFTISLRPDEGGAPGAVYEAGAANADLQLEALVVSEDEMALAGSFAGRLIAGGADELVLEKDIPAVTVDGNFQATIPLQPE